MPQYWLLWLEPESVGEGFLEPEFLGLGLEARKWRERELVGLPFGQWEAESELESLGFLEPEFLARESRVQVLAEPPFVQEAAESELGSLGQGFLAREFRV